MKSFIICILNLGVPIGFQDYHEDEMPTKGGASASSGWAGGRGTQCGQFGPNWRGDGSPSVGAVVRGPINPVFEKLE